MNWCATGGVCSGNNKKMNSTRSRDHSKDTMGKGRRKRSFVGNFNERTHKLIELSRSNSCSRDSFDSAIRDEQLSDSSGGEFDEAIFASPEFKGRQVYTEEANLSPPIRRRASFFNRRHHKLVEVPEICVQQLELKCEPKKSAGNEKNKEKESKARRSLNFEATSGQKTPVKQPPMNTNKSPRTPKGTLAANAVVQETPVHKRRPLSEYRKERFKRACNAAKPQIVSETPEKLVTSFYRRRSPRKSARDLYSNPDALIEVDDQEDDSKQTSSSLSTASVDESQSPAKKGDPQWILLKEFLTGQNSPQKQVRHAVRATACSKS